jgi:hypothetical protein
LLLLLLLQVAEIATLFDDDGILVRFMNSNTEGNSVRWVACLSCHQSCMLLVALVLWEGCASQALLTSSDTAPAAGYRFSTCLPG